MICELKIKLFIFLFILIFSITCASCSDSNKKNNINASYVEVDEYFINGDFFIIQSTTDLYFLLNDNVPEKYDYSFFTNNSLVAFKKTEPSSKSESEIISYIIKNNVLTINVETVTVGMDCEISKWWFFLELDKEKITSIESIKVIEDGVEAINGANIYSDAVQTYFEKYLQDRSNSSVDDVWVYRQYGVYHDCLVATFIDEKNSQFPEMVTTLTVNGLTFSYPYGYDLLVYSNGNFYALDEAYEQNILTADDISSIHECFMRSYNDKNIGELEKYIRQFDLEGEKYIWSIEEDDELKLGGQIVLDRLIVTFKKTTTYPDFKLEYLGIEEADSYNWSNGPRPPDYFFEDENKKLLENFRQTIIIFLEPQTEDKIIELVREIEKLDFVYYVRPSIGFDPGFVES